MKELVSFAPRTLSPDEKKTVVSFITPAGMSNLMTESLTEIVVSSFEKIRIIQVGKHSRVLSVCILSDILETRNGERV